MAYKDDRTYTDAIHDNLAVKTIYRIMGWIPENTMKELADLQDSEYSIDYHAIDKNGINIVIQERFRKPSNTQFNDFTIRYERPNNIEEVEQKSEFFKMKAKMKRFSEPFFMIYGILNTSMDGFDKWVVIDLRAFYKHYADKKIIVDSTKRFSTVKDGIFICGWNENTDNSSSFICADVEKMMKTFNDVIIFQEGFVQTRTGGATDKQINMLNKMAADNGFVLKNKYMLTHSDVQLLVKLLKDKETCKEIHKLMETELFQKASSFLTIKK